MVIAWLTFSGGLFLGATMVFEALLRFLMRKIGTAAVLGSLLAFVLMANLKW